CPPPTDIAFLLDGSGSINYWDFITMKDFVISMVNGLKDWDFQFAVAQFSVQCELHIKFNTFRGIYQIQQISQFGSATYTAEAIQKVVDELFTTQAGAREYANRVLVVITDGQSNGRNDLGTAVQNAERKNIVRYAIGVGNAFNILSAEMELKTIASDPDDKHVFKVNAFSVLTAIQNTLAEDIVAIEGTQTSGESTRMEFAQDGFSADFVTNGNIIMSAVGAFQSKGGYQEYNYSGAPVNSFQKGNGNDSYLGYSMTVTKRNWGNIIIQGAPRDNHIGKVIISENGVVQTLNPPEPQIGAYYGAELCVVDLNSDKFADLLLVSAPMHNEGDQEGKVFIYTFTTFGKESQAQHIQTVNGIPGQRGRFGMTLASPADLDGDSRRDVVVGAPLEENGQGSIYIFNGRTQDICPTFSQRISGSSVRSGLQYFGFSVSRSALDHSEDRLPDLAVGSKGAVIILRSRPIVSLEITVTNTLSKIPTRDNDCTKPYNCTMQLCFTMKPLNPWMTDLTAKINYTLKLDAKRQSYRAYFSPKQVKSNGTMSLSLKTNCRDHEFFIEACPNDALNPVSNEVVYTFEGLPSTILGNLQPMLRPSIKNTSNYNLDFEINCGDDQICIDKLKVDFNFSGHSVIQVGIMQEINVTVFIENRGENSYNSRVILGYPVGLSFRKFTTKQGRLECVSVDSDDKAALGETTCYISKPIFKNNSLAVFDITYNINKDSTFDRMVTFTASAFSDNDNHSHASELFKNKTIDVKYAIYIALIRDENSTIYINFTAGENDLNVPVQQIFKVENDLRDLTFDIFIRVPIQLGAEDIWANNSLQIQGCNIDTDEQPTTRDFVAALQKKPEVNCSVAVCRVFKCAASLFKMQTKFYNITGNVSSGWIEQTGLRSAVFELVSTATLDYNKTTYIYYSSDSTNTAPIGKINTQVEVYEKKFPLKETIGGVVGGLVLLALITAGLYKVCGATIPKDCKHFTAYNGMCFTLNSNNVPSGPIPSTLRACPPPPQTDIAFLLDGSGSVRSGDFKKMKDFVVSMVNGLKDMNFQFAVAQFSSQCHIHIKFNSFRGTYQIQQITQFRRLTYTAGAIQKVVDELFTTQAGARENTNRVLVVITDGESNDRYNLRTAAQNAERKKIIRYAIGVGGAFNSPQAENELKTIASDPDDKYVFKVNAFSVLTEIQNTLEENIIAIEGTQTSGESTRMEFAQDGFRADFVANGNIIMSAVGAFQWKGYLGYSMTVAKRSRRYLIIQGAPRDNHMGKVIISENGVFQTLNPPELDFEIDCGTDQICIDNLKVDFNFSGHSVIQVGIMQEIHVTVLIENREENSHNSQVILRYPVGLSFRRFTTKQGRLECSSVASDDEARPGETTCYISKPIFKNNGL
ncbi:integrin alpha-M-like, partial [Clarias magur]